MKLLGILSISLFMLCSFVRHAYYYNAYSPEYDEYFVLKSYQPLPMDTVVHFNNNVVATHKKTRFTAKVLSIYSPINN